MKPLCDDNNKKKLPRLLDTPEVYITWDLLFLKNVESYLHPNNQKITLLLQ